MDNHFLSYFRQNSNEMNPAIISWLKSWTFFENRHDQMIFPNRRPACAKKQSSTHFRKRHCQTIGKTAKDDSRNLIVACRLRFVQFLEQTLCMARSESYEAFKFWFRLPKERSIDNFGRQLPFYSERLCKRVRLLSRIRESLPFHFQHRNGRHCSFPIQEFTVYAPPLVATPGQFR